VTKKYRPMKYIENKTLAKKMFHIKVVGFNKCIKWWYPFDLE